MHYQFDSDSDSDSDSGFSMGGRMESLCDSDSDHGCFEAELDDLDEHQCKNHVRKPRHHICAAKQAKGLAARFVDSARNPHRQGSAAKKAEGYVARLRTSGKVRPRGGRHKAGEQEVLV